MSKDLTVAGGFGVLSWCDKLASTPTIGFFFDAHYAPADMILNALTPFLDGWHIGRKANFSVVHQEAFRVDIQHEDGFLYHVEPTKLTVTFQHRLKLRATSGGLPVAELISRPHPFTKLLADASETLIEMAQLLPSPAKKRNVTQIGIVSQTVVNDNDLPPGIRKFMDHLGRPWGANLGAFGVNAVVDLVETKSHLDRCIHNIRRSEDDEEDLIILQFDYQRYATNPTPIIPDTLRREVASATKAALEYYEALAVGDMFDEQLKRD